MSSCLGRGYRNNRLYIAFSNLQDKDNENRRSLSRSSTRSNTKNVHRTRSAEGRKNDRRGRRTQRRCPECGAYDD
ncbi:hypothetical protein EVAR_18137_1 [Eumeta japonica]|uniref:Uncharacterized protein n=1 Tax=Eumeta variegata TaxID=151549 RepID=A0A4C1VIY4_EUMVA|nr:hypothetical protein EVAR_18137_1 [Eumeta japonica]